MSTKWVDRRTEGYIKSQLRRIWGWDKARKAAKARAEQSNGQFRCEQCHSLHWRQGVQIDHTEPVDRVEGWDGWDNFIRRLFCPAEGLRVLCKSCHEAKTVGENKCRIRKPRKSK